MNIGTVRSLARTRNARARRESRRDFPAVLAGSFGKSPRRVRRDTCIHAYTRTVIRFGLRVRESASRRAKKSPADRLANRHRAP